MPAPEGTIAAGDGGEQPGGAGESGAAGYRVVARRYRPQRFAELVGQEHVARGLAGAILSGRVGHAYLFTGARGVGKTSAARILAKALQCQAGPAAEPCDVCESCQAIASGQDIDVLEIDAASNRGIDEIRQLRQNVAVRPARGRFKVYIVDEVHMLTREAFNALLKTLEEPPGHVKFVLCTTEPDKLPVTILSRCQRFDFHVVDAAAIAGRLAQIAAAEGVAVTPQAIELIARRAAGSMRDSQSLLEQLLGGAGREGQPAEIGIDEVHAVIGTGREELVGEVLRAIVERDPRRALAGLDAALCGGADCGGVLEQLLGALRDCLVASVGCGREALREGPGLGLDLLDTGARLGTATVLAMLQIVDQALARMRSSSHAAVLAEMAIVRLATLEDLDSLAAAVGQLAGSAGAADGREKKSDHRSAAVTPTPPPAAVPHRAVAPAQGMAQGIAPTAQPAAAAPAPAGASPVGPDSDPLEIWRACGHVVGGLVATFAELAVRAAWRGEKLAVDFPAGHQAALAFLGKADVVGGLQRALVDVMGRPASVALEVMPVAEPGGEGGAGGVVDEPATRPPVSAVPAGAAVSQAALIREAGGHALVRHALELFDGSIRRVDPPRPRAADQPAAALVSSGGVEQGDVDAVGEGHDG